MNSLEVVESMIASRGRILTLRGILITEVGNAGNVRPGISVFAVCLLVLQPLLIKTTNKMSIGKYFMPGDWYVNAQISGFSMKETDVIN